jgi:hypothetical protein
VVVPRRAGSYPRLLLVRGWFRPARVPADTGSYFVHLRSLAFDRDVDFANDWELLAPCAGNGQDGHRPVPNSQTLGPALLWSPFFAMAHAYVRVTGALGLGLGLTAPANPIGAR